MSKRAWVTLATNDSYGLGALVLVHSLRQVGSVYPAVVLITPAVTEAMRERLRAVFAEVVEVNVLDSRDSAHLALLQRPELGITFTKLHCWGLTQYEKCVFLDADALVVQNSDELFEREELSAAPDVGWPDCFNSGVFVYRPSTETFDALIEFAEKHGSFDGGDQGLLNQFFSDWASGDIRKHLPFLYNVTSAAFYSYLPALKYFGRSLKIIHFIGSMKPWLQPYNWQTQSVEGAGHLRDTLQLWWSIFVNSVHPTLDEAMVGSQAASQVPLPLDAHYYEPEVNPRSEFPWHREEPQPLADEEKPKLDTNEYFDPWDQYRGNIPLKEEHNPPTDNGQGRVEISQDVRDYIWEQKQTEEFNAPVASHNWQTPSQEKHRHHEDYQRHHEPFRGHQQHDHGHHESHHQNHAHQPHNEHRDHEHHNQHHHHHHHQEHRDEGYGHGDSHPQKEDHGNQVTPHEHSLHQPNTHKSYNDQHKHKVEQIQHVQIDREDTDDQAQEQLNKKIWNRIDWCDEHGMMNGYLFEEEFEIHRPRHPYDGFYLRHTPALDSNGKKVCSHQLPPTPPPTPPPESPSPPESMSDSENDQVYEDAVESQSGVAGNLARVVTSSYHGDAIDELTRRQSWEAGNIDYMGADSFDNIWAKISETLKQQQAGKALEAQKQPSPPKQAAPVKQPSPPKQAAAAKLPSPPKEVAVPAKQPSPPKQAAPVKQPSPSKQAAPAKQPSPPKEVTVPAKQPSPPKQAAPVKQPSPPKLAAPAKQPSPPKEVAAPAKQPSPPKQAAPVKQPSPPKQVAPAKQPSPPKQAASAKQPVPPKEVAVPAEQPSPLKEATAPVKQPSPPKGAASAKQPSPPKQAPVKAPSPPKAQSAPVAAPVQAKAPAVSKTPPATPKSTPEATTPVTETTAEPCLTPKKSLDLTTSATDSPPLANTPAKEEASPSDTKTEGERSPRGKPAGKLQLLTPAVADPLPTPDSELEDADSLAQSIIAGELATPTVTQPTPTAPLTPASPASPASPAAAAANKQLSVDQPTLDTPPVGPVSLAQIGVKAKGKPTTAAQIASFVTESETPPAPTKDKTSEPTKTVVKKVAKKDAAASGAKGEAPVPPPRKKEKKPKDK